MVWITALNSCARFGEIGHRTVGDRNQVRRRGRPMSKSVT
ncbi:hypothetical protein Pd630_LPD01308 [Rhodococcus opacus PD630]|nr:hypothetical protein Pd630_LPD01308 [Rhodococcus opacus PD630]